MNRDNLYEFLEEKFEEYNQPGFIANDPISIPHQFDKKQDIEIAGFFAAVLAWGQRKTIINKCNELLGYMDHAPYDFICNYEEHELKPFLDFKHRTFNATDTLYFLHWLKAHYSENVSLESAFLVPGNANEVIENALVGFYDQFFSMPDHPARTHKHIPSPQKKSACKRLNMFLRWMVRKDERGVDLGIWDRIQAKDLVCPLDVHVERVARKLGLIKRKQADWTAAIELTQTLRTLDPNDPVKYDFALFGLGVEEKF
jgi:uncharacterized protein (TIGR02757 family)